MSAHDQLPNDDELDRLLQRARWPEPHDEQTARLAQHWRRIQVAEHRRRRRLALGGLALAASILLVVAMLRWRDTETAPDEIAAQPHDGQTEATRAKNPPRAAAPDRAALSRDPNLYEQVVLMATTAKSRERAVPLKPADRAALVDELIELVSKDPQADVDDRLVQMQNDLAGCERLLWKIVRQERGERQLGAARVLSRIATGRSLPVLMELAGQPTTHEPAMLGLARLASDRDLAQLATIEPQAGLRRQLLRMLLARRTGESVGLFLAFVNEIPSRSEALGVLAEMEDPPGELLLGYLESPWQPVRLAAALALSRVPDPAVVKRLCASVAGISRREALIALLLSSSEQATGCLNEARENLFLVASVQAAEQQLESLRNPRGGNLP